MGAGLLRPDFEHDLDGLFCHGYAVIEVEPEFSELAGAHALADAEIEAPARQIIQHGGLSGEPQWVMEGHGVDVVAETHVGGALDGRSDHQIGAGQQGIIGEVVFGEPAFAEPQRLRQGDLVQHLGVGLIMGHPAPLTVVKESKIHARLLMT
jgi:hypothetical protein